MLIRIREFITEEEFKALEEKAHTTKSDYLSNLAELSRLRRKSPFLFFETGRATLDLGQPRPLVAPLNISGTSDELLARIILGQPELV
ncbi:MAG: hypothetical protein U9N60_10235 [Thermodesulfobacteriota bacterium]|nr:hypothetical protein [Thermodesulfobacteriota bacterium]